MADGGYPPPPPPREGRKEGRKKGGREEDQSCITCVWKTGALTDRLAAPAQESRQTDRRMDGWMDGPSDEAPSRLTGRGPGLRLRRDLERQPPSDSRRCPQQKGKRSRACLLTASPPSLLCSTRKTRGRRTRARPRMDTHVAWKEEG